MEELGKRGHISDRRGENSDRIKFLKGLLETNIHLQYEVENIPDLDLPDKNTTIHCREISHPVINVGNFFAVLD